jgi:hypothetical protein
VLAAGGNLRRAAAGGTDLSAGTLDWGRREGVGPPLHLTSRDLRLMALLYDVNFLSAGQLLLLGWGATQARAGQARLKRLHDGGYLDRFRPVKRVGSAEWNYRLSSQGWSVLRRHELVPDGRTYTPVAITSISYTEHDLQLAALVLQIAHAAAGAPAEGLIEQMPFTWQGPHSGRIESDHAQQFECSPAAELPPGTRLHPETSRRGYLEPDATLIGGSGEGRQAVLIEYDRTERPHKQTDRLRRYDRWLLDGWRRGRFAAHASAPVVVFVMAREQPLRRLVETADKAFSAWHGHQHAGPREGTHAARQQVLFTSQERVLAGDRTMYRAPSLPPELRDEPGVCFPRTLAFDLSSLFSGPLAPPSARRPAATAARVAAA